MSLPHLGEREKLGESDGRARAAASLPSHIDLSELCDNLEFGWKTTYYSKS